MTVSFRAWLDFSSAFERVEVSIESFFCLVLLLVVSSDASVMGGKGFVSDSPFPSAGIVLDIVDPLYCRRFKELIGGVVVWE